MFTLSVLLALVWMALTGEFSVGNFLEGLLLVTLVVAVTQEVTGGPSYLRRLWRIGAFFLFFAWELVQASLKVAFTVLTPGIELTPGVIAVPLSISDEAQITLLANLITLTPGTLSLDVAPDRSCIYVHTIDFDDAELFRAEIKEGFERRIQELFQ